MGASSCVENRKVAKNAKRNGAREEGVRGGRTNVRDGGKGEPMAK